MLCFQSYRKKDAKSEIFVSILFRYFLHYGVRLISAWSAAHLYVEVSTQFSGIVDIITTTALYTE